MSDYLEPYRRAVRQLGPSFESLLWRDRSFQEIRFKVLLEVASAGMALPDQLGSVLRIEDLMIADLGAGRADLAVWMHRIGLRCRGYTAVEAIPELASAAEASLHEIGWDHTGVVPADFVGEPDLFDRLRDRGASVLLFSGSLNTLDQESALGVIERAFESRRRAGSGCVVFNFLSSLQRTKKGPVEDTGPARRFDTLGVLERCAQMAERLSFRQEYLGAHDATVGLFV